MPKQETGLRHVHAVKKAKTTHKAKYNAYLTVLCSEGDKKTINNYILK